MPETGPVDPRPSDGSDTPPGAPAKRLPMLPTPALIRAAVVVVFAAVFAVLLGRIELLLVVVPLLAWVLMARGRRMLRGEAAGVGEPRFTSTSPSIAEGGSVGMSVGSEPGTIVSASTSLLAAADLDPPYGSVADAGSARFSITPQRWGRYEVGPVHVLIADALGAYRAETEVGPALVRVTPDSSLLEAPVDIPTPIGISGMHLSRRRGDGSALADVREFRPGDRLNRINWRVTSRTGTMHTNATFTEQDTDILIVTDTVQEVKAMPRNRHELSGDLESNLDMTIRATAAIARYYLGIGDRVSVHDLGSRIGSVRAGTGNRQLRMITETLSRARHETEALARVRPIPSIRSSTLVVVCSPLLSDKVIAQIGHLMAQGADVIVVDTLPSGVGDVSALTGKAPWTPRGRSDDRFWQEAWAARRLLRETTVRELREQGVPVTPWEGPASLGPVLLSLAQAGSAPRMRRN